MAHLFKTSILMLCMAMSTASLVACSDDDDDDGGGSGKASTTAGVLDKKSGLRVKSFGDYTAYYDDNGRIDYIREGSYSRYEFAYKPNTITLTYGGEEDERITVGYNANGYIASMSASSSYSDGDDRWSENAKVTLTYDGSGHLTKISGSGKESGIDNGERFNETWTSSYTFTWRSNLLTKVVFEEKEVEDGETETENETWTFEYDNNDFVNVYRQWAPSITKCLDDFEEFMAYVGLLGNGPSQLPTSAERNDKDYYDGKQHTDYRTYSFGYSFNDDGSLYYTSVNGSRYYFTYDYADSSDRNTRAALSQQTAGQEEATKVRALSRLFHRSHRH